MPVSQLKTQNHIDGYTAEHIGIASDFLDNTNPENCLIQREIKAVIFLQYKNINYVKSGSVIELSLLLLVALR